MMATEKDSQDPLSPMRGEEKHEDSVSDSEEDLSALEKAAEKYGHPSPPVQHEESVHHGDGHHETGHQLPFYLPPQQRQRWGQQQLPVHTDWGDIYFDLFYVAAAYNLGNLLREDPTRHGLLYYTAAFLPIIYLWVAHMGFFARFFFRDDVLHRLFETLVLLPLATAVLHIRTVGVLSDPHLPDMFVLCLSTLLAHVGVNMRYFEVFVAQVKGVSGLYPEAAWMSAIILITQLPSMIFYVGAVVYSGAQYYGYDSAPSLDHSSGYPYESVYSNASDVSDYNSSSVTDNATRHLAAAPSSSYSSGESDDVAAWLLLVGTAMQTIVWVCLLFLYLPRVSDPQKITVPLNIDYSLHRYGEWVMLMIGESVLSLLIVPVVSTIRYYEIFVAGILGVIFLEYLHVRSQPHEPDHHAMRRKKSAAMIFVNAMNLYSLSLVVFGACLKMFLYEIVYEQDSSDKRYLHEVVRLLAGGESAALRFDTDDRRQWEAHLFSGSLSLIFACMDIMTLAHSGLDAGRERFQSGDKVHGTLLLFFRSAIIVFTATLSQYETNPVNLTLIGLFVILFQVSLRLIGSLVYPPDDEERESKEIDRLAMITKARLRDYTDSERRHSSMNVAERD